jgi:hypothetical protein
MVLIEAFIALIKHLLKTHFNRMAVRPDLVFVIDGQFKSTELKKKESHLKKKTIVN